MDATYLECWLNLQRHADAYAYINGEVDREAANRMIYELQAAAGWFPLEVIEVDAVVEAAVEQWQPFAEVADLAREAADQVADGWESSDNGATGMAVDLIAAWAEERGIALVPRDDGLECPHCHEPCGDIDGIEERTWQQWRCPCCGSWNDREVARAEVAA